MTRAWLWLVLLTASRALAVEFTPLEVQRLLQHSPLPELPKDPSNQVADDPRAARLGKKLFFDTRLSSNGRSCATCHDPSLRFTDGRARHDEKQTRNTPSLINVAFQRWFFWDGRADSLWSQALQPLEHKDEQAGDRRKIVQLLVDDSELQRAYLELFGPAPLQDASAAAVDRAFANIGKVLAAFQRTLIGADTPFDQFVADLRSNRPTSSVLSESAQRGAKLFVGRAGCRSCHSGPLFSDLGFHSIGLPPLDGRLPDPGRYDGVMKLQADRFSRDGEFTDRPAAQLQHRGLERTQEQWGQFRTPSLRHVAQTAPYMHDGRFSRLEQVLAHYSSLAGAVGLAQQKEKLLAPLHLSASETEDLIAFLHALGSPMGSDPAGFQPPSP